MWLRASCVRGSGQLRQGGGLFDGKERVLEMNLMEQMGGMRGPSTVECRLNSHSLVQYRVGQAPAGRHAKREGWSFWPRCFVGAAQGGGIEIETGSLIGQRRTIF